MRTDVSSTVTAEPSCRAPPTSGSTSSRRRATLSGSDVANLRVTTLGRSSPLRARSAEKSRSCVHVSQQAQSSRPLIRSLPHVQLLPGPGELARRQPRRRTAEPAGRPLPPARGRPPGHPEPTCPFPQGFLFGVKAFGPLTGHPTDPARLPEPARLALPPELRSAERLWPRDLPRETLEACQDGKRAQPGSTRAVSRRQGGGTFSSDRDPENQLSVWSPGGLGKAPAFPPRLEAHQPELLQDPQVCLHALEIPPQHPGKLVHRLRSGSADGPQQLHASRREDPAGAV
jgi:hypothetical protein